MRVRVVCGVGGSAEGAFEKNRLHRANFNFTFHISQEGQSTTTAIKIHVDFLKQTPVIFRKSRGFLNNP